MKKQRKYRIPDKKVVRKEKKPRAIDLILKGKRSGKWYKDGAPQWLVGKRQRKCQTRREASIETKKSVKVLRRHAKDSKQAQDLAMRLEQCKPRSRCTSGACPRCVRATQRWFTQATSEFLDMQGKPSFMITIIDDECNEAEGSFESFTPLKQKVRKALRDIDMHRALGGYDISLNEHNAGKFKPHWQPHLVVFTREPTKSEDRQFRESFKRTIRVKRPIYKAKFDGKLKGIAYALKNEYDRRVTTPKTKALNGVTEKRRNSTKRPLRARQKVELMLALDRMGLMARIFKLGVAIVEGPKWPVFVAHSDQVVEEETQ